MGDRLKGDFTELPAEDADSCSPAGTSPELEAEPTDDLQALLSRAAINASTYKEFASTPRAPSRAPKAPRVAEKAVRPAVPQQPRQSAQVAERVRVPAAPKSATPWAALDRVLSGKSDKPEDRFVQVVVRSIAGPTLFVCSPGGGTGKTTILATLARYLAANGERVLVAEGPASALLPFYFGAQTAPGDGVQSFSLPESDAGVDVFSIPAEMNVSHSHAATGAETREAVAALRDAAGKADRVLLDLGPEHAEETFTLRPGNQLCLIPLVPDLNCVLGVTRLESSLRALRESTGAGLDPYYLLNKFDSSLALHRSIQSRLKDELGERLLPFTIRRSDAIPEALADGKTVIDYCPDAGIAEDFVSLANWLGQEMPADRAKERA